MGRKSKKLNIHIEKLTAPSILTKLLEENKKFYENSLSKKDVDDIISNYSKK